MDIGSRIKEIRKNKKITQLRLSELTGINRASITQYENGTYEPSIEKLELIANALNVTVQDLFDPSKKELIAKEEITKNPLKYVDYFPEIQLIKDLVKIEAFAIGAGAEALVQTDIEYIYLPKEIIPKSFDSRYTKIGKIVGDSMEPEFCEGDIVFLDMVANRHIEYIDGIYLIQYGDVVQLKRVQFLGNSHANIISLNPKYPTINTKDLGIEWQILGKPYFVWKHKEYSKLKILEDN